jgi:hypothetical protein
MGASPRSNRRRRLSLIGLGWALVLVHPSPLPAQDGGSAAPAPAAACFSPRPLPRCGSFWITEFGLLQFLGTPPGNPEDERRTLLSWEVGYMGNLSPAQAVGGSLFLAGNDNQFRLGVRGRYRVWMGEAAALELGPGVIALHSDEDLEIRGTPGASIQVGLSWRDWLTLVGQTEFTRSGTNFQVGGRFGSYVGALLGGGVPVLMLLLMCEDSS